MIVWIRRVGNMRYNSAFPHHGLADRTALDFRLMCIPVGYPDQWHLMHFKYFNHPQLIQSVVFYMWHSLFLSVIRHFSKEDFLFFTNLHTCVPVDESLYPQFILPIDDLSNKPNDGTKLLNHPISILFHILTTTMYTIPIIWFFLQ